MKERTIKEPKGKGTIAKKDLKKAVKKVAADKKDVATPKKDNKPAGGKNDKEHNSERPASGKADGKSRKK